MFQDVLKTNSKVTDDQKKDLLKTAQDYVLIAVVDAKKGPVGTFVHFCRRYSKECETDGTGWTNGYTAGRREPEPGRAKFGRRGEASVCRHDGTARPELSVASIS